MPDQTPFNPKRLGPHPQHPALRKGINHAFYDGVLQVVVGGEKLHIRATGENVSKLNALFDSIGDERKFQLGLRRPDTRTDAEKRSEGTVIQGNRDDKRTQAEIDLDEARARLRKIEREEAMKDPVLAQEIRVAELEEKLEAEQAAKAKEERNAPKADHAAWQFIEAEFDESRNFKEVRERWKLIGVAKDDDGVAYKLATQKLAEVEKIRLLKQTAQYEQEAAQRAAELNKLASAVDGAAYQEPETAESETE